MELNNLHVRFSKSIFFFKSRPNFWAYAQPKVLSIYSARNKFTQTWVKTFVEDLHWKLTALTAQLSPVFSRILWMAKSCALIVSSVCRAAADFIQILCSSKWLVYTTMTGHIPRRSLWTEDLHGMRLYPFPFLKTCQITSTTWALKSLMLLTSKHSRINTA